MNGWGIVGRLLCRLLRGGEEGCVGWGGESTAINCLQKILNNFPTLSYCVTINQDITKSRGWFWLAEIEKRKQTKLQQHQQLKSLKKLRMHQRQQLKQQLHQQQLKLQQHLQTKDESSIFLLLKGRVFLKFS